MEDGLREHESVILVTHSKHQNKGFITLGVRDAVFAFTPLTFWVLDICSKSFYFRCFQLSAIPNQQIDKIRVCI